ncbi:MAG: 6-bladed beta-propeller [Actinomycetota bacterium]|nr:6-bladed beta-propeller [Actinomycetota bacterium]
MPLNIAISNKYLFVTDSGNKRVAILTRSGSFIASFSGFASELSQPIGVAIDKQKRIYVSMLRGSKGEIMVFSGNSDFLYRFPQNLGDGSAIPNATLGKPVSLFSAGNLLYVTDVLDQDIKVYNLEGKLVLRFGRPGNKEGEFLYPNGIAVDKSGNIYVSDSNNARIQVFDKNGNFLYLFSGTEKDPLSLPRGIAIDKQERLHVVDSFKHKVFVFTKTGRLLFTYGGFGRTGDGLAYPNGIAIDRESGDIYIADKLNNRISVWR